MNLGASWRLGPARTIRRAEMWSELFGSLDPFFQNFGGFFKVFGPGFEVGPLRLEPFFSQPLQNSLILEFLSHLGSFLGIKCLSFVKHSSGKRPHKKTPMIWGLGGSFPRPGKGND